MVATASIEKDSITEVNKILNLYPIDYPFETLVARANSIPKKLILDPEFQRKYKWDKDGDERGSRFIESCLMRIPLPACYFAERENGVHEVIDGVQRITTIQRFFNDEFALAGLTIFKELEGKKFSQLGDLRSELESTTIRCIILRKENKRELVKEIFARLNQGAVQLTPQEIRHAVYPGTLDDLLSELAQNKTIQTFKVGKNSGETNKVKDSLEPEEMILRYFAMQSDLSDYNDRLSRYLDSYMEKNKYLDENEINNLKIDFNTTLNKCISVFGDKAFMNLAKGRKQQSLAIFDLQMWSFINQDKDFLILNKEKINTLFIELCESDDFAKTLSGGLQRKTSILQRRKSWSDKLSSIINNE